MSSGSAGERELVFCHECEEEFWKDEHGLTCPHCTSDFTEVVSQSAYLSPLWHMTRFRYLHGAAGC